LPEEARAKLLKAVREFKDFDEGNDPHHEHDLALIDVEGERFFFKIDYYDLGMRFHSPDPADPSQTTRALTIGFAADY